MEINEQKKEEINNVKTPELDNQEIVYIYESPDKGKTIYRRPFGAPHDKREILENE